VLLLIAAGEKLPMPTPEDITDQHALLTAHRATLNILLRQKALAGAAYTSPSIEHGILQARNEIRRIKTVLVAWGEDVPNAPDDEEPVYHVSDPQRKLKLTVHLAVFTYNGLLCYFINATNISDREIEITHVWFESEPRVHALQSDRPLPKRLKPDETWETWVEVYKLAMAIHEAPYERARARLSTGEIIQSRQNDDVIDQGYVPGGPIRPIV
jgi:hypothetical protein